jgi:hypothetical protein
MLVSKSGLYIDSPTSKVLDWLCSFEGTTTANGDAVGTTIVCDGLIAEPSYDIHLVKILSGNAAGQLRVISTHTAGTNTLLADSPFTDAVGAAVQIVADTRFIILSILGSGNGTSSEGLFYYGTVTAVPGVNQFTIPTLAGLGAGKFAGVTNPYQAFVLRDAAGLSAAPQGEQQPVTAYVTATGVFTTTAYTAAVGIGDEILLLNPNLATALGISTIVTNIFNLVNSMLVTTETGGTLATTGAVQNVYLNNAPTGVFEPLCVKIDLTNLVGGEVVVIRSSYRIAAGGNLILQDTVTFTGVQAVPLKQIELQPNRFGVQVTLERTAGAARNHDWEVVYRS